MRKKLWMAAISLACVIAVSGCGAADEQAPEQQPNISEEGITVTPDENDVEFQLSQEATPTFGEDNLLDDVPEYEGDNTVADDEGLYVERDGYAYRLDPATLDIIDEPLDPVTHEPIVISDSVTSGASGEEVTEPASDTPSYTATEPTEETKYPNTGIFLEDD